MLCVGFGHKARQGKDWLAAEVRTHLPHEAAIFPIATSIKHLARFLGMQGKNPPFLQRLCDALRTLDEAYALNKLVAQLEEEKPPVALIPDVRFKNEARWIREQGGLLYRVRRLWDGDIFRATDRDPTHISETDLDSYREWTRTFDIEDGDIQAMQDAARTIVADIQHLRGLKT